MSTTDTASAQQRTNRVVQRMVEQAGEMLRPLQQMAIEDGACLEDFNRMQEGFSVVRRVCGPGDIPGAVLVRMLLDSGRRLHELVTFIKSLKEEKPVLGWVLSRPFTLNGDGGDRFIYAGLVDGQQLNVQVYKVAAPPAGDGEPAWQDVELPPVPYVALVEPATKTCFGPATRFPPPPLPSHMFEVLKSNYEEGGEGPVEIEVTDGIRETPFTLLATAELARRIKALMEEDGQAVRVRAQSGMIATGIHQTEEQRAESWISFPQPDQSSVFDLQFPARLRRQWHKDIERIASGHAGSVKVLLIGSTGTGKTSAVRRVAHDAYRRARESGRDVRGIALIEIQSATVGSIYIHATERAIRTAFRRAATLAARGYIVVVLLDEIDGFLGESAGLDHSHRRSERLTAQSLLGEDIPGVAVYGTMNARSSSYLPTALEGRFRPREYGRPTKGQMGAVAASYAGQHPAFLASLGMSAEEFGGMLVDGIYADERVVATVHYHSGEQGAVRARDLQQCSPRRIKDIVNDFALDVESGDARSLEELWSLVDEQLRAPNLNVGNLFQLTFLKERPDDSVKTVDLRRR